MTMRDWLVALVITCAACQTWQGVPGDRSSSWTWMCGGDDDDDGDPAPDSGCPMDVGINDGGS